MEAFVGNYKHQKNITAQRDLKEEKISAYIQKDSRENQGMKKLKSYLDDLEQKSKRGRIMQVRANVIDLIIDAVKEVDKDFDSQNMTGTVVEFQEFCNKLCPQNFFPVDSNTFRDQAKGKIKKIQRKHFCKWGQPPKPNKTYWDNIYNELC